MLASWLSSFEQVHRATTVEEREAIFRFRYDVYIGELHRDYPGTDHANKRLASPEDDKPYTTLLYTGTPANVTSTAQVRTWAPGQVPEKDFEAFSMALFPGIERLGTGEIGRVMIRPTLRGKLLLPSLLRAAYEYAAGEAGTDLGFFRCSAGHLRHYLEMVGARTYGGKLIEGGSSAQIPLVIILSDYEHFRKMNSIYTPFVKRYFGPGKRPPLDITPFRHLLERDAVQLDVNKVWEELQTDLLADETSSPSILESLSDRAIRTMARSGFLLSISKGDYLTRQGTTEREMFIILDGVFEVLVDGTQVALLVKGDLFGEIAFFRQSGARTASVRALQDNGRVLVLRRKFLDELLHKDPDAAWQLVMNASRIMAERLAGMLARPPADTGTALLPQGQVAELALKDHPNQ